eukprot:SRR837773.8217.p1 GENE.SRR837773.8217~~SRR837773.8217.p1  ORF type:complete len:290 (-),score=28.75 SRR837773.8217:90-959(-)
MEGNATSSQAACIGEWEGRGKTIKISKNGDELQVDMGPKVPMLALKKTSSGRSFPMSWAVVNKDVAGKESTVYLFELPSPASSILMVRKPNGDGEVEFSRVGGELVIAESPAKKRHKAQRRSPRNSRSFADSLAKIVTSKKLEHVEREKDVERWHAHESKLLDQAVELTKQRCLRAAREQKASLTVSFEVLSREIGKDFPQRVLSGTTIHVGEWGGEITPECWFWSTRGVQVPFPRGTPILFAEVLQSMLAKFVDRLKGLGFTSTSHEAGTWKVTMSWPSPEDEHEDRD